jgi:hypothetical protein
MKKVIYAVVLLLIVSSLVFAYQKMNHISSEKTVPRPLTAEATPAGVQFKKWEASPEGKKVLDGIAKISKQTSNFTDMEAVITSLSLPPGSRLGFGVMARIKDADYILSFGVLKADEFQQLQSLKVNDKIIIRSRGISYAPKYAYPIVSGDYVERDSKVIYKRVSGKGGC